jgi:aquaporin related protein
MKAPQSLHYHQQHTLEQSSQIIITPPTLKIDPYVARAPIMNIHHCQTMLIRVDPLQKLFRSIFDALSYSARGHAVAVISEFIGTILFLVLGFSGVETASASSNKDQGAGVSTSTKSHTPEQLLYIALAARFSLAITAWTFFRISGGLFNLAVSSAAVPPTSKTRKSIVQLFELLY